MNQYTSVSGQSYCYDPNGNLTADGQFVYLYDVENRLVEMRAQTNTVCTSLSYAGQIKAKLHYDPMGRLYQTENFVNGVTQGKQTLLHDSDALVAVFNANGTLIERHVHGPNAGVDDPLISYYTSNAHPDHARFLHNDARGSIVYSSDRNDGNRVINTYDEHGQPGSNNLGRFQYTGQVWLPELGMYYYKARIYSPRLGRFMQTDPIGYEDNVNLYGYVGQDPINAVDPTGLALCGSCSGYSTDGIVDHRSTPVSRYLLSSRPQVEENSISDDGIGGDTQASGIVIPPGSDLMAELAENAADTVDEIPFVRHIPYLRGIWIHKIFDSQIQALKATGVEIDSEVSYLNGVVVPYGTPNSVRADGVLGDIARPVAVYELKTSDAHVTIREFEAYRQHLPRGTAVHSLKIGPYIY